MTSPWVRGAIVRTRYVRGADKPQEVPSTPAAVSQAVYVGLGGAVLKKTAGTVSVGLGGAVIGNN